MGLFKRKKLYEIINEDFPETGDNIFNFISDQYNFLLDFEGSSISYERDAYKKLYYETYKIVDKYLREELKYVNVKFNEKKEENLRKFKKLVKNNEKNESFDEEMKKGITNSLRANIHQLVDFYANKKKLENANLAFVIANTLIHILTDFNLIDFNNIKPNSTNDVYT